MTEYFQIFNFRSVLKEKKNSFFFLMLLLFEQELSAAQNENKVSGGKSS